MSGCHPENLAGYSQPTDMGLCDHGRILTMNNCYYCKQDKEKLEMLKRVLTLENFIGQNYMRDMDALGERVERLESEIQKREIISKSNPHKCPACDGFGRRLYNVIESAICKPCEGQGILWK